MSSSTFNNKLPNLKHLNYLLALDKYQHFNKAAEACFVSQSTLSSAILKLEQQLCCQLLEREHKRFIFTSHGKQVVALAQKLLLNANEFTTFAQQQGCYNSGSVNLGCIPTIAPFILTDLVQACQKDLPNIELYLREDTTDNLLFQLEQGEIDCAIVAFPIPKNNFFSKKLGQDDFYIAGDKTLVNRFQASLDYQSLPEKSVFLLNEEHCLTEHAVSACKLADASLINSFSASSLATLVQMTAFHHGVTFLPEMAVNKGVGKLEGLLIEPMKGEVYRDIGIVWRKTSMREATFMSLADVVSKASLSQ
ncbi:hydrogen peroxide-inducible genes activator [Candidatus Colwellia aromaticivorans]|uniref:hydrogen peroxide-inducible genes activator n=1 Tax=Candidatus Colwellia aromaticivorans TaxID=2267621 RepID=UPI000DF16419|nr:hydrogen peroxide-inducible genes activator [Candidatus Colwellia aromaticivorans]